MLQAPADQEHEAENQGGAGHRRGDHPGLSQKPEPGQEPGPGDPGSQDDQGDPQTGPGADAEDEGVGEGIAEQRLHLQAAGAQGGPGQYRGERARQADRVDDVGPARFLAGPVPEDGDCRVEGDGDRPDAEAEREKAEQGGGHARKEPRARPRPGQWGGVRGAIGTGGHRSQSSFR